MSRRQLMRVAIGAGDRARTLELLAGTVGFAWPNLSKGFGGKIKIGTLDESSSKNTTLPIADGFPAYFAEARALVVLNDPSPAAVHPRRGHDRRRLGPQRPGPVPALPAPRLQAEPVHQELLDGVPVPRSRYDRLGIKADGAQYGPAPRSMDRFSIPSMAAAC